MTGVMTAYLIRRLLAVIPVMAVVVTVVFLLIHLIPGDPVAVMLGPDATPAQIDGTRKALGLDRPLLEQLLLFYKRILRGDLGRSYFLDRPVTQALWERAEPTLVLTVSGLLVALVIGVPSGIVAGANQGSWWDRLLMMGALLGVCIPELLAKPQLHLPIRGQARLAPGRGIRVDPDGPLGGAPLHGDAGGVPRIQPVRPDRPHRAFVHGRGPPAGLHPHRPGERAPNRIVAYVHGFRNALVPVVTVIGVTIAILVGGAVVTEIVFNIPGMGASSSRPSSGATIPWCRGSCW